MIKVILTFFFFFTVTDFILLAKKTALNAIREQKSLFAQLGILANWDHSYLTMSPEYIVKQLEVFSDLYEKVHLKN